MGVKSQSFLYLNENYRVDADDPEERKIIEDLLGASMRFKQLGIATGEGFMSPPIECLTPGVERQGQPIYEGEESQISEPALQQKLWQYMEPNVYDAFE